MKRSVYCTTLALGDVAVLVKLRPRWTYLGAGLGHPVRWLETAGPDVALAATCAALLWLAAVWVAVGLVTGLGTRAPGAIGQLCARLAQIILPTVLTRVVLGSTALGLLAVPAVAQAATTASARVAPPAAAQAFGGVPAPTWPVFGATSESPSSTRSGSGPTQPPAPVPPTSAPRVSVPSPANGTAQVHRGDSLWLLAAHRLGPHADAGDIAQFWPQIYATNRSVIGDDPAVIHPGQIIDLPLPTQESSP